MSKVLVIGNGFDLDLGLKTRYIDFWNSNIFQPHRNKYRGMIRFLDEKAKNDSTWFDIESLLREYVKEHSNRNISDVNRVSPHNFQEEKNQFNDIRSSLAQYLEQEVSIRELKAESTAAKVLRAVTDRGLSSIYSFNYTDLHKIAKKLNVTQKFEYSDVHGRSFDNSLILGIDDSVEVVPHYEFVYKTFSPYYHSVPLKFDLDDADEVVIFGLSMGNIDYPYFQDFFRNICDPKSSRKDSKRITIFTYDEDGRLNILRQLRQMNEKRVNYMFGQNDFTLIRTRVEDDRPKIDGFLKRMEQEIRNEQKKINDILMMS